MAKDDSGKAAFLKKLNDAAKAADAARETKTAPQPQQAPQQPQHPQPQTTVLGGARPWNFHFSGKALLRNFLAFGAIGAGAYTLFALRPPILKGLGMAKDLALFGGKKGFQAYKYASAKLPGQKSRLAFALLTSFMAATGVYKAGEATYNGVRDIPSLLANTNIPIPGMTDSRTTNSFLLGGASGYVINTLSHSYQRMIHGNANSFEIWLSENLNKVNANGIADYFLEKADQINNMIPAGPSTPAQKQDIMLGSNDSVQVCYPKVDMESEQVQRDLHNGVLSAHFKQIDQELDTERLNPDSYLNQAVREALSDHFPVVQIVLPDYRETDQSLEIRARTHPICPDGNGHTYESMRYPASAWLRGTGLVPPNVQSLKTPKPN